MKKRVVLFGAIAISVLSLGFAGCQDTEEAAAPAAAEDVKVEQPATEHPADAKPKDHPAH